ncbi:MAG: hypothetical protein ACOC5R_03290 [Elusimicrobiota bacterium]
MDIVKFNNLSLKEQTEVLGSLPVMDKKDPALLTAKMVAMQEKINKEKLLKLAQERGWKFDSDNNTIMLPVPEASNLTENTKGIRVERTAQDSKGRLVLQGVLLIDGGSGSGMRDGKEIYLASAESSFSKELIGKKKIEKGNTLIAVVHEDKIYCEVFDGDNRKIKSFDTSSKVLTKAVLMLNRAGVEKKSIFQRIARIIQGIFGKSYRVAKNIADTTAGAVESILSQKPYANYEIRGDKLVIDIKEKDIQITLDKEVIGAIKQGEQGEIGKGSIRIGDKEYEIKRGIVENDSGRITLVEFLLEDAEKELFHMNEFGDMVSVKEKTEQLYNITSAILPKLEHKAANLDKNLFELYRSIYEGLEKRSGKGVLIKTKLDKIENEGRFLKEIKRWSKIINICKDLVEEGEYEMVHVVDSLNDTVTGFKQEMTGIEQELDEAEQMKNKMLGTFRLLERVAENLDVKNKAEIKELRNYCRILNIFTEEKREFTLSGLYDARLYGTLNQVAANAILTLIKTKIDVESEEYKNASLPGKVVIYLRNLSDKTMMAAAQEDADIFAKLKNVFIPHSMGISLKYLEKELGKVGEYELKGYREEITDKSLDLPGFGKTKNILNLFDLKLNKTEKSNFKEILSLFTPGINQTNLCYAAGEGVKRSLDNPQMGAMTKGWLVLTGFTSIDVVKYVQPVMLLGGVMDVTARENVKAVGEALGWDKETIAKYQDIAGHTAFALTIASRGAQLNAAGLKLAGKRLAAYYLIDLATGKMAEKINNMAGGDRYTEQLMRAAMWIGFGKLAQKAVNKLKPVTDKIKGKLAAKVRTLESNKRRLVNVLEKEIQTKNNTGSLVQGKDSKVLRGKTGKDLTKPERALAGAKEIKARVQRARSGVQKVKTRERFINKELRGVNKEIKSTRFLKNLIGDLEEVVQLTSDVLRDGESYNPPPGYGKAALAQGVLASAGILLGTKQDETAEALRDKLAKKDRPLTKGKDISPDKVKQQDKNKIILWEETPRIYKKLEQVQEPSKEIRTAGLETEYQKQAPSASQQVESPGILTKAWNAIKSFFGGIIDWITGTKHVETFTSPDGYKLRGDIKLGRDGKVKSVGKGTIKELTGEKIVEVGGEYWSEGIFEYNGDKYVLAGSGVRISDQVGNYIIQGDGLFAVEMLPREDGLAEIIEVELQNTSEDTKILDIFSGLEYKITDEDKFELLPSQQGKIVIDNQKTDIKVNDKGKVVEGQIEVKIGENIQKINIDKIDPVLEDLGYNIQGHIDLDDNKQITVNKETFNLFLFGTETSIKQDKDKYILTGGKAGISINTKLTEDYNQQIISINMNENQESNFKVTGKTVFDNLGMTVYAGNIIIKDGNVERGSGTVYEINNKKYVYFKQDSIEFVYKVKEIKGNKFILDYDEGKLAGGQILKLKGLQITGSIDYNSGEVYLDKSVYKGIKASVESNYGIGEGKVQIEVKDNYVSIVGKIVGRFEIRIPKMKRMTNTDLQKLTIETSEDTGYQYQANNFTIERVDKIKGIICIKGEIQLIGNRLIAFTDGSEFDITKGQILRIGNIRYIQHEAQDKFIIMQGKILPPKGSVAYKGKEIIRFKENGKIDVHYRKNDIIDGMGIELKEKKLGPEFKKHGSKNLLYVRTVRGEWVNIPLRPGAEKSIALYRQEKNLFNYFKQRAGEALFGLKQGARFVKSSAKVSVESVSRWYKFLCCGIGLGGSRIKDNGEKLMENGEKMGVFGPILVFVGKNAKKRGEIMETFSAGIGLEDLADHTKKSDLKLKRNHYIMKEVSKGLESDYMPAVSKIIGNAIEVPGGLIAATGIITGGKHTISEFSNMDGSIGVGKKILWDDFTKGLLWGVVKSIAEFPSKLKNDPAAAVGEILGMVGMGYIAKTVKVGIAKAKLSKMRLSLVNKIAYTRPRKLYGLKVSREMINEAIKTKIKGTKLNLKDFKLIRNTKGIKFTKRVEKVMESPYLSDAIKTKFLRKLRSNLNVRKVQEVYRDKRDEVQSRRDTEKMEPGESNSTLRKDYQSVIDRIEQNIRDAEAARKGSRKFGEKVRKVREGSRKFGEKVRSTSERLQSFAEKLQKNKAIRIIGEKFKKPKYKPERDEEINKVIDLDDYINRRRKLQEEFPEAVNQ